MKIKQKLLLFLFSGLLISCSPKITNTEPVIIVQEVNIDSIRTVDSIYYTKVINDIKEYNNRLLIINNKLINANDSLREDNFIYKYKLERIRFYNNIAVGDNLKFLRGWINRVLDGSE